MSKVKPWGEGEVGDKLVYHNSGYSSTIIKVEKTSWGGILYHLEDGKSTSPDRGQWKYFTIFEKEEDGSINEDPCSYRADCMDVGSDNQS